MIGPQLYVEKYRGVDLFHSGAWRWLTSRASFLLPFLLLVIMASSLTWQSVLWWKQAQPATVSASVTAPKPAALVDIQQILPLFGRSVKPAQAVVPITNLRLTLLGSFMHVDPQRSSAIIQSEDGKAKRYQSGAEISKGVYLYAIYRDLVELKRNGQLEALSLAPKPHPADAQSVGLNQQQSIEIENDDQLRKRMEALNQQFK